MDRTKQLEDVIAIALQHMATAHYEDARISLRAALAPAEKVPPRMMINASDLTRPVHEECPDCRGVCVPVKDAPVSEPVPFHEANIEANWCQLQGRVTCKLSGDRRIEVWGVKDSDDIVIRIYRPTLDGKESCLKFGLHRDAAMALRDGLGMSLSGGASIVEMLDSIKDDPATQATSPVKAPVVLETSCCQCNWSNTGMLNMAQDPGYAPELWCHGCLKRLVDAHRDETGKFIKLKDAAPSPVKVPVVESVTTFVCPRCGNEMMQDYELCGDPWVCSKCDFPCGNARKPAVDVRDARRRHLDALADEPAIEPLDDRDYGRAELKAKMNELIARVNALEGGRSC